MSKRLSAAEKASRAAYSAVRAQAIRQERAIEKAGFKVSGKSARELFPTVK